MTDSSVSGHSLSVEVLWGARASVKKRARPTFEAVYASEFDQVWRYAARMGVREADRDDLTQEVFVVVHRSLATFRGESTLRTWVFGIARKTISTYFRRRRRKPESLVDPQDRSIEAQAESLQPARQYDARESLDRAKRIIDAMPFEQREVFVLVEIEQLSVPEVAKLVGASLNTAYSRLRLARRRFNAAAQEGAG